MSRVLSCDCSLLKLPLARPVARVVGGSPARLGELHALLVRLRTDAGVEGVGVATAFSGGRALLAAAEEIAPTLVGEDALAHERLAARALSQLPEMPAGLFRPAYSAFDLAAWDAKGKLANLPVWKLLGGAAESALAFAGDAAGPGMSAAEVLDAARPFREKGVAGVYLHLAGSDPEADCHRAEGLRDKLGDDVWFAVRAEDTYELRTALAVAHYIEDEVGADWFERLVPADDLDGHAKLAANIEVPVGYGTLADDPAAVRRAVERGACGVARPDVQRLGGLTPWLAVAAYARACGRPVVPSGPAHVCVTLACGVPGVHSVAADGRLDALFGPVGVSAGRARPAAGPGLGLALTADAAERYRVG